MRKWKDNMKEGSWLSVVYFSKRNIFTNPVQDILTFFPANKQAKKMLISL